MNVHGEFYNPYVEGIPEDGFIEALERNRDDCLALFARVDEEKSKFRYAEGKWSIREVLGHISDGERVFAYRALCFARGEKQSLPGYEENDYADESNAHERSWKELVKEFEVLRESTIILFKGLSGESIDKIGTMNESKASVRSIGRIIAGHSDHHLRTLKERYSI